MTSVQLVTQFLSLLTLLSQVGIGIVALGFATGSLKIGQGTGKKLVEFVSQRAYVLAYIVAFVATAGSLFYSEVAHYTPCKLCWFQRIFMYPQVLLTFQALWKKDRQLADYLIAMSVIGAVIALYHYLLQIGVVPELQCSAVGVSVKCSDHFSLNYGYITIPLMAFTAFTLIILSMISTKLTTKKASSK